MSPLHIEAGVNYLRLRELAEEFTSHWTRLQALYLDAAIGFELINKHVASEQKRLKPFLRGTDLDSADFLDSLIFTYTGILADDFCTSGIHQASQGEVRKRNMVDGENYTTIGQLCVVSFCASWNDYLRREYVIAKGRLNRNEKDDKVVKETMRLYASNNLWGDLNIIRNCIIHNKGTASSNINQCKVIKWFKTGDQIKITPHYMRAIFLVLLEYRNGLFNEQFPKRYVKLPYLPEAS